MNAMRRKQKSEAEMFEKTFNDSDSSHILGDFKCDFLPGQYRPSQHLVISYDRGSEMFRSAAIYIYLVWCSTCHGNDILQWSCFVSSFSLI